MDDRNHECHRSEIGFVKGRGRKRRVTGCMDKWDRVNLAENANVGYMTI